MATDFIGAAEVAKEYGIAMYTVDRACRLGQIKGAKRIGRSWVFSRAAFEAWQKTRRKYEWHKRIR